MIIKWSSQHPNEIKQMMEYLVNITDRLEHVDFDIDDLHNIGQGLWALLLAIDIKCQKKYGLEQFETIKIIQQLTSMTIQDNIAEDGVSTLLKGIAGVCGNEENK